MVKKKKKKAQNEIVGFVLIIIIVSVIGVIFLSFMIGRGEPITQESVQISNLLSASMYYTTDCAINYIPNYENGQDLIKSCWNNKICLDDRMACDVLNSTMKKIIGESLDVNSEVANKAYNLIIYYKDIVGELPPDVILESKGGLYGNCSSEIGGSHSISVGGITPGLINIELKVCRG
jgi:hypothetical protein